MNVAADLVVGQDQLARPVWAATDPLLRDYYDTEWGMPVRDEAGVYERLVLEGFQAGLAWVTVLRKREAFREVFAGFNPDVVARFGDSDIERLLVDDRIIRHRAKIVAAITNARATIKLRGDGGLADFIWSFQPETTPSPTRLADIPTQSPESLALAKALKQRGFVFVGPTTMYALMEAIGIVNTHLIGSHRRDAAGVWPK
ncbi:MAG: DNA-3-methyladenine glycosylase I [Aeromicrobium sp.]|nr:MAG: DNA-3-methyladenine glycosylase I [Aeromicrobium sp.]